MFGGAGSNNVLLNDVWLLDVSDASAVWTLNPSVGDAPTGRYAHTMTTLSESTALVFGGVESDGVLLHDVWLLTLSNASAVWHSPHPSYLCQEKSDASAMWTLLPSIKAAQTGRHAHTMTTLSEDMALVFRRQTKRRLHPQRRPQRRLVAGCVGCQCTVDVVGVFRGRSVYSIFSLTDDDRRGHCTGVRRAYTSVAYSTTYGC